MAAVRLADPLYFLDENMESADLADLLTAAGLSCIRISKAGAPFRTHRGVVPRRVAARSGSGSARRHAIEAPNCVSKAHRRR